MTLFKKQLGFASLPIIILIVLVGLTAGILAYQYFWGLEEKTEKPLIVSCISGDNVCPIGCPYQIDKDCEPPKTWDLIASNDSADYLGDTVAYASPSDWRHYQPMIDKVNEITKGFDNDFDKAKSIATWVMHSKQYGEEEETSVANQWGSVIDIFNAKEGVCLDSSFLTTAMMRLAGIPARSVLLAHAYNEVYINGKWMTIEATFGLGEPYFDSQVLTRTVTFEQYEFKKSTFIEMGSGSKLIEFKNVTYYKAKSILKEGFGNITFPFSDTKIYVDRDFTKFSLIEKEDCTDKPEWEKMESCVVHKSKFNCWWHLQNPSSQEYRTILYPAGFYSVGFNTLRQKYETAGLSGNQGYIKASLPEGKYKIICGLGSNPTDNPVSFTKFEIKENQETVITADSFKKAEQASNEQFDILMSLFK